MIKEFELEYWQDGEWFCGRLRDVPGVFSQGRTFAELEENIRDAYRLFVADEEKPAKGSVIKKVGIEV